MMELTSFRGQDKNRADIALVVDAMVSTREHISTMFWSLEILISPRWS